MPGSANFPCGVMPVQNRHLHIHKHQIVIACRFAENHVHRFLPVFRIVNFGIDHLQEFLGYLAVKFVIFNKKNALAFKIIILLQVFEGIRMFLRRLDRRDKSIV